MVVSTLGFAFQGGSGTNTEGGTNNYNGFEFENVNGFWVFGNFVFSFHPSETPDLGKDSIEKGVLSLIIGFILCYGRYCL